MNHTRAQTVCGITPAAATLGRVGHGKQATVRTLLRRWSGTAGPTVVVDRPDGPGLLSLRGVTGSHWPVRVSPAEAGGPLGFARGHGGGQ